MSNTAIPGEEGRKVHVVGRDGRLLYTRLLDTGGNVLEFAGPHKLGFIVRSDVPSSGWELRPGWPETSAARGKGCTGAEQLIGAQTADRPDLTDRPGHATDKGEQAAP